MTGQQAADTPTVHKVKRHTGIAGQFSVSVELEYTGEGRSSVSFVGSVYGGPVIMVSNTSGRRVETFVTDPSRFGDFGADGIAWARRFFGGQS
jgi:hypothetical protein